MPLRVVVIGCGRMGLRRLDALRAVPGVEIAAACDPEEEAARAVEGLGIPCPRDWRDALRVPSEAVFICTPNAFHAPLAVEALRLGRHVFCEKPLAASVEDARAMVEASLESTGTLTVGANLRHFPNVAEALRLNAEEAIGPALFCRAWIGHNGWNRAVPWYRRRPISGGGTLLDNGSHAFDLARLFMGEIVHCTGFTDPPGGGGGEDPVEENAVGIFRDREGRLATVQSSWNEWAGYFEFAAYGTRGYLKLACRESACTLERGGLDGRTELRDYSRLPSRSVEAEVAAYARGLMEGRRAGPGGYDGLRCVRMAFGVYESSRSGAAVPLWGPGDEDLRRRMEDHCRDSSASPGSTATSTRAADPSA